MQSPTVPFTQPLSVASSTLPRLGSITKLAAGEAAAALSFGAYAFLLLVCYYVVKLMREPLLLAAGPRARGATRSRDRDRDRALLLVPQYGALFRRT